MELDKSQLTEKSIRGRKLFFTTFDWFSSGRLYIMNSSTTRLGRSYGNTLMDTGTYLVLLKNENNFHKKNLLIHVTTGTYSANDVAYF